MNLLFGEYEPWMKDQVVDMFCEQYGNERTQFAEYFDRFYSTYQEGKSLRFVITDAKTVAGFVSFSYWPYVVEGIKTNSYQCGNVIINRNYRGKGLYNQLLEYVNQQAVKYEIDFMVGFPIKEIVKLYLKSNWKAPFSLPWHVSIVNPMGKLFVVNDKKLSGVFASAQKYFKAFPGNEQNTLATDESFCVWNTHYNNLTKRHYFVYEEGENCVEFGLKLTRRKYLNELIIGDVHTTVRDSVFITRAFRQLKRRARKIMGISILSFCYNPQVNNDPFAAALKHTGFRMIEKDVKFIVNNFRLREKDLLDPKKWMLFRRDIDTW